VLDSQIVICLIMGNENVRHKSSVALVLVDVVNHFEFPDGDRILKNALPAAPRLARLKKKAREANIPIIYVNDNFGQWRSDAGKLLAHCLRKECAGKPFVEAIQPDDKDYSVLKPMHSAFYQTPLHLLLQHLGASSIVLAGLATNSCILCTAHDANMRDFKVTVVSDCCAARTTREHKEAIDNIREMANARVVTVESLRVNQLKGEHGKVR
jgi:nicotinamidase-related amidase